MAFAFAGVGDDDDDDAVAAARHSVSGVSCGHNVDETAAATPTIKLVDGMVGTRELRSVLQGVNVFGFGSCWCDTPQRHSHSTAVTSRLFQGSICDNWSSLGQDIRPPATSHQLPATSQSTNQRTSQPASNSILCVEKSGTSAIRSPPRIENHSHRSLPSAVPSPHPLFVRAAAVRKWQGDDGNYFSSSSFSSSGGVYVHASKCARTGLEEASCTHARTYTQRCLHARTPAPPHSAALVTQPSSTSHCNGGPPNKCAMRCVAQADSA